MRRFREHDVRQTTDLSGMWDFAFLGDVAAETVDVSSIAFNDVMAVPGCFDATPAYAGRRGLVAYRKTVLIADTTPHRLWLDGVHHWCRVLVDGRPVGDHVGGFTKFAVDFVPQRAGEAQIVVLVDNRFDADRCPLHLPYYDWYQYGGIARSAQLHRLGEAWIDRLQIVTKDLPSRTLGVSISYNSLAAPGKTKLLITCAGKTYRRALNLKAACGQIDFDLALPGAKLWSPQEPNLYELHVQLGQDDMRERVGIRQVKVRGPEIQINGRAVQLRGFCRHESHIQFGHGLPDAMLLADLHLLRDMGCNFVRTSHYPPDERFLDLCDEQGLCVWAESTGWQQTFQHLADEKYLAAAELNVEEMVLGGFNHPSVILWAVLNEATSNDIACRNGYARLIQRIREMDSTRPVTFASNHPYDDVCRDLIDIVAINMYPGWYDGFLDRIGPSIQKLCRHLDETGCDKPLIISEIGAAASLGFRDMNADKWSEQYQARLLEMVIDELFVRGKRACGLAIWQFCDVRTGHERISRGRCFNNKGVVDEYRRPKMAYDSVKRMFNELAAKPRRR